MLSLASRHCTASLSGMSCSLAHGQWWGGSPQQTGVRHAGRLRRPFYVRTPGAPQPRRCPGEAGQSPRMPADPRTPTPGDRRQSPARAAGNRLLHRPVFKNGAANHSTVSPHTGPGPPAPALSLCTAPGPTPLPRPRGSERGRRSREPRRLRVRPRGSPAGSTYVPPRMED